jgi:hypothetical protein
VTDLMHAAAAILMPLGFFLSMPSPNTTAPNRAVSLIYLGAVLLAISVLTLGLDCCGRLEIRNAVTLSTGLNSHL